MQLPYNKGSGISPSKISIPKKVVTPVTPQTDNSDAVITVVRDPNNPLGKQFSVAADGSVKKQSAVYLSLGIAKTHQVNTHEELAQLLTSVGEDTHAAIINARFTGIDIGQEFLILSEKELEKQTGIATSKRDEQKGVHTVEYQGNQIKAVGRFKDNVIPSIWQVFDRDIDQHTPEKFATLSTPQWLTKLVEIFPGFSGVTYLHVPSISSRVEHNGKPVGAGNGHIWFKAKEPTDIERFRTASMLQAAHKGMTWLKPRYSKSEPEKVVGNSITTIFDPSVFTPGRLTFNGKPVAGEGFTVLPVMPTIVGGKSDVFDTTQVLLPEKEKVREITRSAGVEMSVSSNSDGSLTCSAQNLRLDTELETKQFGVITVRELIKKGVTGKVRCQTPFRDSHSEAAFYDINADGIPYVHDSGTITTHWLNEYEVPDLEIIKAQVVADAAVKNASTDCGAPFEPEAVKALSVIKSNTVADYQRYRAEFKKVKNVSVVNLDKAVDGYQAESDDMASTHHGYSTQVIDNKTVGDAAPVGFNGSLYTYSPNIGIWQEYPVDKLIVEVAEAFDGSSHCQKAHEYKAIAEHSISIAADQEFFDGAPVGLACPDGFYRINGDQVVIEKLTPEHRQRAIVDFSPTEMEIPLFNHFLHETFAAEQFNEEEQQVRLLQEIIGATMLGIMHQYHKAILFYEPYGRAGKGTLVEIISQLIPKGFISAVSPFNWGKEYFIADLAGKRFNVVGELPDHEAIPAAAFKTVTGCDYLNGRHPTHRPITFKCEAANLFMSNHLINTKDHSEAFFARWELILFPNSRLRLGLPLDPKLAEKIIAAELPGIAYWALQGAIRLLQQGKFSYSIVHDKLMARWRLTTNSLEEFIHECCALGDDSYRTNRADFYKAYKKWCSDNERRPFAKGRVKNLLEHNIKLGITWHRNSGNEEFWGVTLNDSDAPRTNLDNYDPDF